MPMLQVISAMVDIVRKTRGEGRAFGRIPLPEGEEGMWGRGGVIAFLIHRFQKNYSQKGVIRRLWLTGSILGDHEGCFRDLGVARLWCCLDVFPLTFLSLGQVHSAKQLAGTGVC